MNNESENKEMIIAHYSCSLLFVVLQNLDQRDLLRDRR